MTKKTSTPCRKGTPATIVDEEVPDSFGALRGSVTYVDEDIVSPDHDSCDLRP